MRKVSACTAAGVVGGYPTDGSLSKTSVADSAGQRTQMASILNAALVLLTMLFLASLFEELPAAALGAIVIDAMVGLISFGEMRRYWHVSRADFVFFSSAMAGILFVDIIHGILIGVVLSLLMLIARASKPPIRRLARDPEDGSYLDAGLHDRLGTNSEVLTLRLDGPLFFADSERFKEAVYDMIDTASEPPRAMVLDADSISLTDTDGADALIDLATQLHDQAKSRVRRRACATAGLAAVGAGRDHRRRVRRTALRHRPRGGRRGTRGSMTEWSETTTNRFRNLPHGAQPRRSVPSSRRLSRADREGRGHSRTRSRNRRTRHPPR